MTTRSRDVVAYMLQRLGCTHPFRLSRLLALAEMEALERLGRRLTDLRYVLGREPSISRASRRALMRSASTSGRGIPSEVYGGASSIPVSPRA
ncbi:MAG: hypothetical protein GSR80_000069 [Desulfurococcales archaeon]|nr:hypothetical protein [Desulfurococcales archaeon]